MSVFRKIAESVENSIEYTMQDLGNRIARDARDNLISAGHVDTGALRDSIRAETVRDGNIVTTYIYADAESDDGTMYGEFIELGSGAAHGRPGGRVGTWRYQDRQGKWHTTDGMDADPFMAPAVDANIAEFTHNLTEVLEDIAKYGRGQTT